MRKRRILSAVAVGCTLACGNITGDLDRIIAIELAGDLNRSLVEGTSILLQATALNAAGDSIPGTEVFWRILDVDSLGEIGFTLDSVTGLVTGITPSRARVQARVGSLRSGALTVTITGAPDSLTTSSNLEITIVSPSVKSPAISVQVLDLTTNAGEALGLGGVTVQFTLLGGPNASAFLSLADTVIGDGTVVEIETSGAGVAQAFLGLRGAVSNPDTVTVEAAVLSEANDPIPGSPIRFTVIFGQSQ